MSKDKRELEDQTVLRFPSEKEAEKYYIKIFNVASRKLPLINVGGIKYK
jgi:hypothetical protein